MAQTVQLDLSSAPPMMPEPEPIGPGSLFRTSHGTFYLLLALKVTGGYGERAECLHFSQDGGLIGHKQFDAGYLQSLAYVGRVPAILNVEWFAP